MAEDLGREHVRKGARTLDYAYCPPTSGMHYNAAGQGPLRRAMYEGGPTDPGGWIHNLEHGYVVAAYSCGPDGNACPSDEEMAALKRFFDETPTNEAAAACQIPNKLLVVRFDDMSTRFALLAWDRALLVDTFDVEQAKAFAQQFVNGRAAPEPNVC